MPPTPAELFVGSDTFDQRHKLALHSLVFHRRVGPKQSQGKTAVEKKQALDFTLAFDCALPSVHIVKEKCHRDIERRSDELQARSADAIDAFLVSLYLLASDAKLLCKPILRHLLLDTAQSETHAKFNIVLAARPRIWPFLFAAADNAQCRFPYHSPSPSNPVAAALPDSHIARISTCKTIGIADSSGI